MPLVIDQVIDYSGRLLLWQLTETEEALQKLLSAGIFYDKNTVDEIKNPLRRRQKLVSKLLLSKVSNDGAAPEYTSAGKPYLKNGKGNISFSGCRNYVALLFHPSAETGIDIEEIRTKILTIKSKFVNPEEMKWIRKNMEMRDLHLIWGVKESVFKLIGGGGITFKSQLNVLAPVFLSQQKGNGKVLYSKYLPETELVYYFEYLEDNILVYTIAENKLIR